MDNSMCSFFEDENSIRPQARRGFIVKHDGNSKQWSRPGSAKQVRIPEILEKKVENLQKKQEMWKEREQVWGKERRSLERALRNACKDPNEFYKNLLNNWHLAQKKIKPNPDEFYEKLDKLRGFLNWVLDQSGETPLKYIKQLAKDQFEYLDEIEQRHKLNQEQQVQESKRLIDSLQKENSSLTEKLTSGMQEIINSLQLQIQELSNELFTYTLTLEKAETEKNECKAELKLAEEKLRVRESELNEYTMNIQVLEEQIEMLKETIQAKKMINRMPLQEIAEGSQEMIEKLIIQLKDVEEENLRLKKMNEIYEFEVENLQKAKIVQKMPKKREIDCFDLKVACTQTGIDENLSELDWMHIVGCMALGLEQALIKI